MIITTLKPTPNETKSRTDSDNYFHYNSNNRINFDEMKKINIILTCISMSISSLVIPIFGNWYKQKTGIEPITFYFVSGCIAIGVVFYLLFNIIENFTNPKK